MIVLDITYVDDDDQEEQDGGFMLSGYPTPLDLTKHDAIDPAVKELPKST
jgi:hypothetical protein